MKGGYSVEIKIQNVFELCLEDSTWFFLFKTLIADAITVTMPDLALLLDFT